MRPYRTNQFKNLLRSSVGAAARQLVGDPRRFVIMTNGRSGSNLLVALLKRHGRVWVHSEIFGEYQLEDHEVRREINSVGHIPYFQCALRPMFTEKAVGLKILYHQLDARYGEVRGIPGVECVRDAMVADETLRFIHLKRSNLLSALISVKLADLSGSWHGKSYDIASVEIDTEWARDTLAEYETDMETFDRILPKDRVLEMYYEDLVSAPSVQLDRVCKFLGVGSVGVKVPIRKQTTKPHRDYVSNYAELREFFTGSRYEKYFESDGV